MRSRLTRTAFRFASFDKKQFILYTAKCYNSWFILLMPRMDLYWVCEFNSRGLWFDIIFFNSWMMSVIFFCICYTCSIFLSLCKDVKSKQEFRTIFNMCSLFRFKYILFSYLYVAQYIDDSCAFPYKALLLYIQKIISTSIYIWSANFFCAFPLSSFIYLLVNNSAFISVLRCVRCSHPYTMQCNYLCQRCYNYELLNKKLWI